MLPKRFFPVVLLLAATVIISGCASTGESDNSYETKYRIASDECIRWGLRRGSYDYNRCIEKKLEDEKKAGSAEQE